MTNRHLRKAAVVAAAITAGLLMTACQNDTAAAGGSSSGNGTKEAAAVVDKVAEKTGQTGKSRGVSGTFSNGTVTYLAPGKYIVSAPGKDDQQFWVADDTEVYGTGTICGEAQAKVDAPCTLDQLETATKKGAVNADVTMKAGVATLVSERRTTGSGSGTGTGAGTGTGTGAGTGTGTGAGTGTGTGAGTGSDADAGSDSGSGSGSDSGSRDTPIEGINKGKGVNGTWYGAVSYLAPGKYTVTEEHGTAQQFFVAEDTEIWGYGNVCGGPGVGEGQEGGTQCTEAELESAAKKGFSGEVKIVNGIAATIHDTP
ncbi:hypothetical protein [Streptomyces adelaidensis]|uniref:hypothetical protein n=1 Tax=Streptomyces adelaidensis TaxID=2796465 RepID=UPI0027DDDC67|nr:hypothetical protein [Streptomyces adelaidensis]